MSALRIILAVLLLGVAAFTPACHTPTLDSGGAYAQPGQVADMPFEVADAAFNFSWTAVNAAFKFERDNRALLWKLDPSIKNTMDTIRPQAAAAWLDYAKARKAYKANPTPANLTTLNAVLAQVQRLVSAAAAVIPQSYK